MAVTRIATSSLKNLNKYDSFLAGNTAYFPSNFESIATVTVGSGGSSSISFTSIPSTYKHLQVRGIAQTNRSSYVVDELMVRFNSDTGSNYAYHWLRGGYDSTPAASANGQATKTNIRLGAVNSSVSASAFSAFVIDILDYANTSKYKTARYLNGFDVNGTAGTGSYGGTIMLGSGLWQSTSAISTLSIEVSPDASLMNQYSSFALYGVK
jgi:hypothetical protein